MGDDLDTLLTRAEAAWEEGDLEQALELARRGLQVDPHSLPALDLKAHALAELGEYHAADEAFAELMRRAPNEPSFVLSAADVLIRQPGGERDRVVAGLALLDRLAGLAQRDGQIQVEFEFLRGLGLSALGEWTRALDALNLVLQLDPDHGEAQLERGMALFELCRFDEAEEALRLVRQAYPDEPTAYQYLGLIAERRGGDPEPLLAEARRLAPDDYPNPVQLSGAEFDQAVREAIDALPEHARPHLANTIIDVQPIPTDLDLKEGDVSPTVLGLFRGTPVDERSPIDASAHQTAHITLYQRNLERFCRSRSELVEEIRLTVLHEVGHLLGLDEDDLYERGLE